MDDRRHMQHALALGRRTLGATGANPAVGCVIVKNGILVAVGWTAEGGAPHAETQALKMAGEAAKGATAYSTLEPCSHHGRTPPCADALIRAGVSRVVVAIPDPDPRISGRGIEKLRAAGIAVETGVEAIAAQRDHAGFLSRMKRGRPHVILKMAISADGMVAEAPGKRTAISGDEANARLHLLRMRCDAIMVGANTVRVDDPSLTCRLPGLEHRSPMAVVVDGRLKIPISAKLVIQAHSRPLAIVTTPSAEPGTLTDSGVVLIRCKEVAPGRVDLAEVLDQLGRRGINRLLVEGGPNLASELLAANLVDELMIVASRTIIGPQGVPAGLSVNGFRRIGEEMLGEDTLTFYERA